MDAAAHVSHAEGLLNVTTDSDRPYQPEIDTVILLQSIAHSLIALAIEAGAPHEVAPTKAG